MSVILSNAVVYLKTGNDARYVVIDLLQNWVHIVVFFPDVSLSSSSSLWAETEIKRGRGGENQEDRTHVHWEHILSRCLIRFRHRLLSRTSLYTACLFWAGERDWERDICWHSIIVFKSFWFACKKKGKKETVTFDQVFLSCL